MSCVRVFEGTRSSAEIPIKSVMNRRSADHRRTPVASSTRKAEAFSEAWCPCNDLLTLNEVKASRSSSERGILAC
jgi:hypothetical protein